MLDLESIKSKASLKTNQLIFIVPRSINNILHFITMGRLASGIIHDLINPITALLLTINSSGNKNKEIEEYSSKISEFIKIMQRQIQNDQAKETFSVSKIISDSLFLIKYKALNANVRLISGVQNNFNLFGNPIVLLRALMNLITNAIDSYENCPKENQDVVISAYVEDSHLHISVRDFGCGISEENRRKLFKYFYTNKKSGTGIGLASSNYSIKKEFSGKIKIESTNSEGSIFTIVIPLKTSI